MTMLAFKLKSLFLKVDTEVLQTTIMFSCGVF